MNNFISKARFITLGLAVVLIPFSIKFCHWSLLLFLIICLAEGNFSGKAKAIAQNPLAWVLPAFFVLHLVAIGYSTNVSAAWGNLDKKIAFFLAPLVIVSANPFTKKEMEQLAWIFVASCFAGTVFCLGNAFVVSSSGEPLGIFGPRSSYTDFHPDASPLWTYFSYVGLASGIGIHPTYFALYLYVCVLILMRLDTRIGPALIAYFLIVIVLLSSRIVVLVSVVTIIIEIANKKTWLVGAGALVLVAVTIFMNPVAQFRNTQEYTSRNFNWPPAAFSENPISIRTSLWWLSMNAVQQVNPVIGTGTGDVNDTMAALSDKFDVHNILDTYDPHNQYLHTFIALGAIGLAMLLVVFMVPLWVLFKQREFLACIGLISFMCVCMTESALELQKGIILFALFVSLLGNASREWRFSTQRLNYA